MVVVRCAFGGAAAILLLISVITRERVFLAPGRLVLAARVPAMLRMHHFVLLVAGLQKCMGEAASTGL
jgi:hypothetical protein